MVKKSLKIFLSTFLITAAIFLVGHTSFSNKFFSGMRFLNEEIKSTIVLDTCNKTSENFVDFYKETPANYTFEVETGKSKIVQLISNLINGEPIEINFSFFKTYGLAYGAYIALLVFIILIIILWIPYSCCLCCTKCKKKVATTRCNCAKVSVYFVFFLSPCLVLMCVIGFTRNSTIVEGFYDTACSLFKIEDNLVNGDEYQGQPKWIGLSGFKEMIENAKNEFASVASQTDKINKEVSEFSEDTADYAINITIESQDKMYKKITNPKPDMPAFTPDYLNAYSDLSSENSGLSLLKTEFYAYLSGSDHLLENINSGVKEFSEYNRTIAEELNQAIEYLQTGIKNIEDVLDNDVAGYMDTVDQIEHYFRLAMNWILGIQIGLSSLLVIFSIFLCIKGKAKGLICIFWFIIYLVMIVNLVLGFIFGLVSAVSKDVVYGVEQNLKNITELFIKQSVNSDSSEEKIKTILDTCINKDGNINESIFDLDSKTQILDQIYNITIEINKTKKEIESTSIQLESLASIKKTILLIKNDPLSYIPELKESLYEINTLLTKNYEHYWVVRDIDCVEEYTCINVLKYSLDQIREAYSDDTDIIKYFVSITTFYSENEAVLLNIENQLELFKNNFDNLIQELLKVFQRIIDSLEPLTTILEEYIGDHSIFSSINCSFLRKDVNKVFATASNNLSGSLQNVAGIILSAGFIEFVIIIFTIFAMEYKKPGSNVIVDDGMNANLLTYHL